VEQVKEKVKPSEGEWKGPGSIGKNLPDKIVGMVPYEIYCTNVVLFSGKHSLYFSCYHAHGFFCVQMLLSSSCFQSFKEASMSLEWLNQPPGAVLRNIDLDLVSCNC